MPRDIRRHSRPLRAALAGLGAALVLAAGATTATAVPATFWGVDPQAAPSAEQDQRLARGGVDSIRIPVLWSAVQSSRGAKLDWSSIDNVIADAASAELEVLPFFYDAPSWAVPRVTVNPGHVRTPVHLPVKTELQRTGWAEFLEGAVARYGPGGTFWAAHPGLPERPIRIWQVWNEENFKYFVAKPNPAEYAKLVEASARALRRVDASAKVVLGGMFSCPGGCGGKKKPNFDATDFLDRIYAASPRIKTSFDGVALHPYTGDYKLLTPYVEDFRDVLKANHDAGTGLWITEIGWSSQPLDEEHDVFAKGLHGQVVQLKGAFSLIKRNQAKWHLKRVYWFSVDDAAQNCNFCGGTGLFGEGFVPKPSWKAYVKFAGGTPN